MRKEAIIILLTLSAFLILQSCYHKLTVTGTIYNVEDETPEPGSQGEKEKNDIQQIFLNKYHPHSYDKYTGKIRIKITKNSPLICFDSVCIRLNLEDEENQYKKIFTSSKLSGPLSDLRWKQDTLSVSGIEYLKNTNNLPTQRRFSFLVFNGFMMNPHLILIELTNKNSNQNTDFDKFIRGAKLTYFLNAWLQI